MSVPPPSLPTPRSHFSTLVTYCGSASASCPSSAIGSPEKERTNGQTKASRGIPASLGFRPWTTSSTFIQSLPSGGYIPTCLLPALNLPPRGTSQHGHFPSRSLLESSRPRISYLTKEGRSKKPTRTVAVRKYRYPASGAYPPRSAHHDHGGDAKLTSSNPSRST